MLYRDTNQAKKSHREKREKLQNRTVLLWRGLAKKLTNRTSTLKPNGIHGITISREETSRMTGSPLNLPQISLEETSRIGDTVRYGIVVDVIHTVKLEAGGGV